MRILGEPVTVSADDAVRATAQPGREGTAEGDARARIPRRLSRDGSLRGRWNPPVPYGNDGLFSTRGIMQADYNVPDLDHSWIQALDALLRRDLSNPRIMLVTGDFERGAVAELLPAGRARLGDALYKGRFAGLRDLSIDGEANHMHLDLGRIDRVVFKIVPSVCFGWKPSFDMVLEHSATPALSLTLTEPHLTGGGLDVPLVVDFFVRWRRARALLRERVAMHVVAAPGPAARVSPKLASCWSQVLSCHAAARAASADAPSTADDTVAIELMRLAENAKGEHGGEH